VVVHPAHDTTISRPPWQHPVGTRHQGKAGRSAPLEWLRLERVGVEATDDASSVVASVKAGAADRLLARGLL